MPCPVTDLLSILFVLVMAVFLFVCTTALLLLRLFLVFGFVLVYGCLRSSFVDCLYKYFRCLASERLSPREFIVVLRVYALAGFWYLNTRWLGLHWHERANI